MLNISPLNLLFVILNLLILLVLMKKFLYKPVLGIIAKRQELIDQQFAGAQAALNEAEHMKKQYNSSIADAKAVQEQMIKEARVQAGIEHDRILADAEAKTKKMMEEAKRVSLAEKEKVMKEAELQIAGMAVAAASKIVSQTSGKAQDYAIYEEFLKKAGEKSETDGN